MENGFAQIQRKMIGFLVMHNAISNPLMEQQFCAQIQSGSHLEHAFIIFFFDAARKTILISLCKQYLHLRQIHSVISIVLER